MRPDPSRITGATRLLGLIADRVVQARSPAMANALLQRRGLLGPFVPVPMGVPAAKAASLASRVGDAFPGVRVATGDAAGNRYDLAINATSLGMNPDDPLPLPDGVIDRSALIAECVIAPEMTRLLERAAAKGHGIHTGVPMLSAQMELLLRFMGVPLVAEGAGTM